MKQLQGLVITVLLLIACTSNNEIARRLETAEKAVDSHPERVLLELRADSAYICSQSDGYRARYILLTTLAKDKCYEMHRSTEAMEWAADYSNRHGADQDMANYLLGRVYSDLNRQADAMRCYLKAQEAGGGKSRWAALACSNIGHLHFNHGEHAKALPFFEKTLTMAMEQADTTMMIYSLRDMARYYKMTCKRDSSLLCFMKADSLIMRSPSLTGLTEQVYPEYISLLVDIDRSDMARRLVSLLAEKKPECYNQGALALAIGRMYHLVGKSDSAEIFLRRSMESSNVNTRAGAAMYLGEMKYVEGDYTEAYACAMECAAMIDSSAIIMQKENANLTGALANQLSVERENARLQLHVAIVIIVSVVLIAVVVVFMKHRNNRLKRKAEQYEAAQQMMQRSSQQYIDEATRNIEKLNAEIAQAKSKNDLLQEQLLTLNREQEQHRLSMARDAQSLQAQLAGAFRTTALYDRLVQCTANSAVADDALWQQLEEFLDANANGFVGQLQQFYPQIKSQELYVCCLIKVDFNNSQIANMLCRTQQAVTNMRKRLYFKMFNKDGAADDLNSFIRLFPY